MYIYIYIYMCIWHPQQQQPQVQQQQGQAAAARSPSPARDILEACRPIEWGCVGVHIHIHFTHVHTHTHMTMFRCSRPQSCTIDTKIVLHRWHEPRNCGNITLHDVNSLPRGSESL